ncbi:uncharacterized protein TRIVIDRAFT_228753 [Trichoderma virens Gv29-8]|uniref:Uncharacterized protein n=1 Tax=Hypocrea virens (strain Gv29-8 / FGSC 10586) TaxID=413071 RepID=G9NDF9_HYPVG|nr:uncharacterized protein TRIVIDRAFT_228753 [Trichoderma virens Gv29-8]EHK15726.1 hypothetical protein TRIVIDRAFT_228753 [Trichoderma virens Gv29-8]
MRSTIIITAFVASVLADYSGTPEECAVKCTTAHDACLTKPDTNRAQCAADYADCLGYNPYENGFVTPTACSKTTAAPTHTKPPSPPKDECKCYDEYNKCRSAPGANMSYCASQYAECLGYNPFDGQHNPDEIEKKCSKPIITPTPTPPPPPPKPDCRLIKKCNEERDVCRGKPGANQADCSAKYAECLGFNPFTPDGEHCIKECEEEHEHKPPHNGTAPPVHPTNPPIVSGGSGMKPLELFSFLAAGIAALL